MAKSSRLALVLATIVGIGAPSCRSRPEFVARESADHYRQVATEIEYPQTAVEVTPEALATPPPRTVRSQGTTRTRAITLEEAVQTTLANSEVIREAGGRIVSAPGTVSTVYDAARTESDPLFGPEAALSDFDALLTSSLLFGRNERTPNNFFISGGVLGFHQNVADFQTAITKRSATGTLFALSNRTLYDRNNIPIPPNRFASAYDTVFEAAVRQPLLQGAGITFNRIAGPDARPGNYNGVLIGRINTDVSLADFEASVRDLLLEVERTYWELYFSYRNLDAKRAALEAALQTWRAVESRRQAGLPGADSEREALAREQYYAALADVENALSGTFAGGLVVSTTTGLYNTERRLRYLMGIPINDEELLRPADEPIAVDVAFDWNDSLLQALTRRVELRRQKFIIRRRELELLASRNFLRMRLDTVAAYRWRGFGDDLFGSNDQVNGSAFEDVFSGNLQEWQLGLELSTPIGNRIGHTAVRNAEWNLTREMAVLEEQERDITRGLSRAFSDLDWAYNVSRANYNRTLAASQQLQAVQAKYDAGLTLLEFVIDAQRRAAEAASTYYRSLVDYSVAVANVHLARGTLLDYLNVYLTESPWSGEAYDSAEKQARRFRQKSINYCCTTPRPVSVGAFPQQTLLPADAAPPETLPTPQESLQP